MRGGAQAHLLEADDGHHYVVKCRNNPQHRRILINEIVASSIFDYLGLPTPKTAIVDLSASFLESNPEVHFQLGQSRLAVDPGWHFGSRFPAHPERITVYDFLPDMLLDKVTNLRHFLGALAADKWMGNADARQAIFFRASVREFAAAEAHPLRKGFVAQMIDHGFAFDGPNWSFVDAPGQGLYFRHKVYEQVRGYDAFEPWLSQIRDCPPGPLDAALTRIPPGWLEGRDEADVTALLEKLYARRRRIDSLIGDLRKWRVTVFPNWP